MSENSRNLIKLLDKIISRNTEKAAALLDTEPASRRDLIYDFTMDDAAVLRSIPLSEIQKSALKKLLLCVSRNTVYEILCVFDGIFMWDDMEIPNILLVDQETREYIADEELLNESFMGFLEDEEY
ncbi:MAG TPA: hypothetical protein PKW33_21390 [Anaerolineaceae bacterium]|nr:hypothetical protein [Anaerolineaceae bacterium]HPN54163.1 hypothetical protein [Anaerolineaceae bacterium]